MKYIIKKSDVVATQENGISRFHEYQFPFQHASLGISEINGRYPEKGFDIDEEVEASWYVEEGEADIWIGGEVQHVEKGDMVYVPKAEKYWIDGKNLRLVVASSPVWYPEQHKHIEE